MNGETPDSLKDLRKKFEPYAGVFEIVSFDPKIYINSFPKSGTHLANLICSHLAHRQAEKFWLGSFRDHSWSVDWVESERIVSIIDGQNPGTWFQGHLGYRPEFEDAFRRNNVCMFFVYRDLRDVVVSQAYHIESADGETHFHPGKEDFLRLGSHKEVLKSVITGLDRWPGIFDRWELYAGWLDVPWVLPIRFEDMIGDPNGVAAKAVDYVLKRTLGDHFLSFEGSIQAAVQKAIELLGTNEYSPSFRKGVSGEWRNEFDDEVKDLFKKYDRNKWLERLDYEENREW